MKLWIYTDGSPLSYPLFIEKTAVALAKKCGVSEGTVRRSAWRFKNGYYKTSRYEVVEVEDEDNNNIPRRDHDSSRSNRGGHRDQ